VPLTIPRHKKQIEEAAAILDDYGLVTRTYVEVDLSGDDRGPGSERGGDDVA